MTQGWLSAVHVGPGMLGLLELLQLLQLLELL